MSKFQVSYKLALAVLVLPTLVFVYLVGMSVYNGTGLSSAENVSFEEAKKKDDDEPTNTPTATPTATLVPTATVTPTVIPTATVMPTATLVPTATAMPTATVTPTDKPGQEVCPNTGNGWFKYDKWADAKTVQSHDAGLGYIVTEVCVKGSTDIHYFTSDGEMYCWEVEGIGTQVATASETWADANAAAVVQCHDISHASFKVALVPTATPTNTPTPTDTPVVTPTETPVVTPTTTSTPTVTPTSGQILGIDATTVPTATPVYQARVLAVTGNSMYVPVGVGMIIMGLAMILGTDSVLLKRK